MSRFLVAVGGTGQHLALALSRLVTMGAVRRDVRLVAIDPDNESPLAQTLNAPAGRKGDAHPLQSGAVMAPFSVAKYGEAPFERIFVDPHHPREQELFEMMFDADMASIPVHKGMYGTPCVGATVFADGASAQELQSSLKPLATASQVVVCGSVIGGTGAGVIHKLIGEIRRYYDREMYGVFMLPWFQLEPGAASAGAITPAVIGRNARHGIKFFYEHTIPKLTASVLVGYPGNETTTVLRPLTLRHGDMGEHPHYLHLIAAHGALKLKEAHTAQRDVKAYAVAHDPAREGWLLDDPWEHPKSKSLREVVRAHRLVDALLGFLLHEGNWGKIAGYYAAGGFIRMGMSAASWGDLHKTVIQNQPNTEQRKHFVEQMRAELAALYAEVRFCTSWAQELFGEALLQRPGGDPAFARLQAQKPDNPQGWEQLRELWSGKALEAPHGGGSHSGAQAARHHFAALLEGAFAT